MARTPTKIGHHGGGRQKIEIDWDKFDMMCQLQCTLIEIAGWFDCSEDTIERAVVEHSGLTFAEYHTRHCGKGNISLRRSQFQKALSGNVQMMIWLGKQRLGQKDNTTIKINTTKTDELSDDFLTEVARKFENKPKFDRED